MADNKLPFALSFERQYAGPLDPTTVFETYADMQAYLTNETRYAGQIAYCNEDGKLYYLVNRDSWVPFDDEYIYDAIESVNARLNMTMTAEQIMQLDSNMSEQIGFISDNLNSLQTALDDKADVNHIHNMGEIIDDDIEFAPVGDYPFAFVYDTATDVFRELWARLGADHETLVRLPTMQDLLGKANIIHTHTIENITDLQTTLNAKAATAHTHEIANVTNLQTTLNGKAATSHTHTIANVTGLQTALDAKAATAHTHTIANVTGLQTALDAKAATSHTHTIANVAGLQTALEVKADTVNVNSMFVSLQDTLSQKANDFHFHTISEVSDLHIALEGKASVTHTHPELASTDNWAYAADNGNIIVQGTASVGTFTIKVKYKLYQSAVTKSVNLFPSSMKCGHYVRFELCEYCRNTSRGAGGYYPKEVGFTINKFFDNETSFSGNPYQLSDEQGAGYMFANNQDDNNRYFGSTQRAPFNLITFTVDHNDIPSGGNTWIVVLLTGTIL